MKMVTFAVDQQAHSLIVTFPAFIKNYKQPPLSLYEVETVPVPIIDKNVKANSYSQVRIEKSYIAAGTDYYIQLNSSELLMCKCIRHIYYCEELFVIKHKSRHSCVSAIFYNLGPATITKNCKFDYYYNTTVPPVILDGGRDVLLANFHGPRALKCSSVNGGLSKPTPEIIYAVVNREFLCDCQLDLEHASVLRQLSSCANSSSSRMHMKFTMNLAFWELFKKRSPNSASNIQPQYVEEEQVFSVDLYDPQIGKLDQPVDLERFMETMGTDGQKMPTVEEREAEQRMQKIMPRWLNNILVMTCTDGYYTRTFGKALQDEGFGIYVSNTNCPTTSRSSQFNSSNDVSYDSPRPSNWNKSSVCIPSGCDMAKYTWIFSASICHYTIFQTSYLVQRIQVQ